eukprot:TRINITY_DN971_c0_g1_i1.p1 TRINITY_DN971_c0_g1~~TRINITY_DN971_c0_g1_i1.p1  ORF type:complete len:622 (-),score=124.93 TRINITY_DN971_c0_g1_i1:30-1895(-)
MICGLSSYVVISLLSFLVFNHGAIVSQVGVPTIAFTDDDDTSWSNEGNTYSEDGIFAQSTLSPQHSAKLISVLFDFDIPKGTTLKGVEVKTGRRCTLVSGDGAVVPEDEDIELLAGYFISAGSMPSTANLPWRVNSTTFYPSTYGGPENLWGNKIGLARDPLNEGTVSAGIRVLNPSTTSTWRVELDYIRMIVYYDDPKVLSAVTTNSASPGISTNFAASTTSNLEPLTDVTMSQSSTGFESQPSQDSSSPEPSSNRVGIIAGATAAGSALLFGGVAAAMCLVRKKREKKRPEDRNSYRMDDYGRIIKQPLPPDSNSPTDYSVLHTPQYGGIPMEVTSKAPSNQLNNSSSSYNTGENKWAIRWGDLTLQQELGRGTFGIVFKATWRNGDVAVKKLLQETMNPNELQSFSLEVSVLSNLRPHVNIVQFLGASVELGKPFCLVTEFMPKGNLFSFLRANQKTISNQLRRKWVNGIAAGMRHLQEEGVIHRDLAARNILLTTDLSPKICDFGMSRINEDDQNTTESGVGPLKWMSPESLMNREYSVRSDVWSFGVTLFEIYTAQKPYENMTPAQTAIAIATKKAKLELPSNVDIAPEVRAVYRDCLNYDKSLRPDFVAICARLE